MNMMSSLVFNQERSLLIYLKDTALHKVVPLPESEGELCREVSSVYAFKSLLDIRIKLGVITLLFTCF